ncbi:MAG: S53 family peptidase [Pseudomonadota bacterium]|nr:S53 family peptidase [Pseudomonadota bacterium]
MPAGSRKPRRIALKDSKKAPFTAGKRVGPARKGEEVTVTLRLRRRSPLASPCDTLDFRTLAYDEFRALHGADPRDVAKVEAFAHAHGLDVPRVSLAQRAVDLSGTVAAMEQAFGVKLERYTQRRRSFRIRIGEISIPADLAGIVEGVFGLDNRPQVEPHFRIAKGTSGSKVKARATVKGFTPLEVAALYAFPKGVDGKGQTIAILEFGGGYRVADLNTYFAKVGIKPPKVIAVSVGAAHNAPTGNPDSADAEVALDIEVAGAVAPAAQIVWYFAPNTDDGFANALYASIHDNLRRPSVVSISWGAPEKQSTLQSLKDYDAACVDAAALGITICAAAGDHGSSDTSPPDKRANVDFPASSPHVLACGGTHLEARNGAITLETVWNAHDGWATGGRREREVQATRLSSPSRRAEVGESRRQARPRRARRRGQWGQRDRLPDPRRRCRGGRRWHQRGCTLVGGADRATQRGEANAARICAHQAVCRRRAKGLSRHRAGRQRCLRGQSRLGCLHWARKPGRRRSAQGSLDSASPSSTRPTADKTPDPNSPSWFDAP